MNYQTKFLLNRYLNSKHWPLTIILASILVALFSFMLVLPRSIKEELKLGIVSGQWRSVSRRMVWLWNASFPVVKMGSDLFFDYSSDLSVQATLDSYELLRKRQGFEGIRKEIELAQLSNAVIENQIVEGDSIHLENLLHQKYYHLYLEHLRRAQTELSAASQAEIGQGRISTLNQAGLGRGTETQDSKSAGRRGVQNSDRKNKVNRLEMYGLKPFTQVLDVFDDIGVEVFLTSGTFLGCVREGGFLAHDIDIDLGVLSSSYTPEILQRFSNNPNFSKPHLEHVCKIEKCEKGISFSRACNPSLLRLMHKNGIQIDIFIYHGSGEGFRHGGALHQWENSSFCLDDYEFYGRVVKGPANADKYLTENYGNWRVPMKSYNCSTHSNNLLVDESQPKTMCLFLKQRFQLLNNN